MPTAAQDKFRKKVKVWLAQDRSRSVTALARRIGRRRDTVSRAINQDKFPLVREQIAKEIAA
jgi:ABC-type taurine transport system substrate-binding protein